MKQSYLLDLTLKEKTLRQLKYRDRYNVNVIAIWRGSDKITSGVGNLPLQTGDALLIQGTPDKLQLLNDSEDLIVVGETPERKSSKKSKLAIGIFALCIIPVVFWNYSHFNRSTFRCVTFDTY